jgi:hypothetical protein
MQLGELVCCKDFNQINWFMSNNMNSNTRIVVLDDDSVNIEGYIQGSILLPPPSALFNLVDNNDIMTFQTMYYQYLQMPDVDSFIMLLITALFRGTNIIFFFNSSDPSMFMDALGNFLYNVYGITATPFEMLCGPHPPSINPNMMSGLLFKMVQYQYISQDEYNSYFIQSENSPFQKFSV